MDYAVWGLNPLGHHLTSNILHALNTFVVVLLVMRLLESGQSVIPASVLRSAAKDECPESLLKKDPCYAPLAGMTNQFGLSTETNLKLIAAAITGLLFGLHPLHVESVAWVSERKDLLCALFFMLSVMMYTRYVTPPILPLNKGRREEGLKGVTGKWYFLSLVFFVLALLSKPMAVTLPIVLLILDWYPFGRVRSHRTFRAAFLEKLPFVALILAAAVLTVLAQRAGGTIRSMQFAPLSTRLLVGVKALVMYLWKMVLPLDLVPFYPYPKDASLLSIEYLSAIVLVGGITIACVIMAKRQKLWLSVWGYYVITLLPVIGIVEVGLQSMADRYTYLPSLGPFLLIGIIGAWVWERLERLENLGLAAKLLTAAVSVTVFVSLSYLTVKQTGVWRNSIVFWSYVIEKEPERVPDAYNNRGSAFYKKGLTDKAIEDFDRAISLDPSYYEAYNNRGTAFLKLGLFDKAIADFDKTISMNPGHAAPYVNRGKAYFLMGWYVRAEEDFNMAISIDQDYAVAYLDRGTLFFVTGNKPLAVSDFQKACQLGSAEGCARLARVRG
jgi:Tfp pilus assembly protein PilF